MRKTSRRYPRREDILRFRDNIVRWFSKNKRTYPWRDARDPFRVLIAEMMLRRTKADQVKPVYETLFKEYPSDEALAAAKVQKLERILHPLGLRWRTPAFRLVAREISGKYHHRVPDTREELTSLPGVGDYVAGAVLSIGFGKQEWIVDANVARLFRRYFGIVTSGEARRDKHVMSMAKEYSLTKSPRRATLAILDFAALICTPRKPKCSACPLSNLCFYFSLIKKNEQ